MVRDDFEDFMDEFIRDQSTLDLKPLSIGDLDALDRDEQLGHHNDSIDQINMDEYSQYLQQNMENELDQLDWTGYGDNAVGDHHESGIFGMENPDIGTEMETEDGVNRINGFFDGSHGSRHSVVEHTAEESGEKYDIRQSMGQEVLKNGGQTTPTPRIANADLVNINANLTQRLLDTQQQLLEKESRMKQEFNIQLLELKQEMLGKKEEALVNLHHEFKKEKQDLINKFEIEMKGRVDSINEIKDIKLLLEPFGHDGAQGKLVDTVKLVLEHVQSLSEKLLQYEEKINTQGNTEAELNKKICSLEAENKKLQNGMQELEKKNEELSGSILELEFRRSISSNTSNASKYKTLLKEANQKVSELNIELLQHENTISKLESENVRLKRNIEDQKGLLQKKEINYEPKSIQDLEERFPSIIIKHTMSLKNEYDRKLKEHQNEYIAQLNEERKHMENTCLQLKKECKSAYDQAMSQLLQAFKDKEGQVLDKLHGKYKQRLHQLNSIIETLRQQHNDQKVTLINKNTITYLKTQSNKVKQKYIDTLKSMRDEVENSKLDTFKLVETEWKKRRDAQVKEWNKKTQALKEHCFNRHAGCSRCLSILAIKV